MLVRVPYVVGYVMFSVVTCVVNHATFLFNSTVTFLNLPPTMGPKHPNDESTTCNHNDGSLCRRRELMRTVTLSPWALTTPAVDGMVAVVQQPGIVAEAEDFGARVRRVGKRVESDCVARKSE